MEYKKYNDYELLYMVQEKDDFSEKILYRKYYPILKNIAYDYYSHYSHYGYELDDFMQEAYLSFQKAITKFDERQNSLFYTFVCACVHRGLLSFCRNISNTNRNISYQNLVSIEDCPVEDPKSDLSSIIGFIEFERICNQLIFDLPDELSPIFELRYNGFTYNEIGSLLDIPSSTVEFRYRKIRKQLKNIFEKYYVKRQS